MDSPQGIQERLASIATCGKNPLKREGMITLAPRVVPAPISQGKKLRHSCGSEQSSRKNSGLDHTLLWSCPVNSELKTNPERLSLFPSNLTGSQMQPRIFTGIQIGTHSQYLMSNQNHQAHKQENTTIRTKKRN
jgi:hypothetical protein